MISAGIDIGSITTKCAVVEEGVLLGVHLIPTGYQVAEAGERVCKELLGRLNIPWEKVERVISTGYGRNRVAFAHKSVTEITCHAVGAYFQDPKTRSVIDIGGQDSKVIAIGQDGTVADFIMNDKCAAGTGRFLEVMARALEVDLTAFGEIARAAEEVAPISSLCTVFAESEVVGLIARGEPKSHIIAGIHESIASRVVVMGNRMGMGAPVMMTGGVALNRGVVRAIEAKMNVSVMVSDHAQVNGAIGAAVLAGV